MSHRSMMPVYLNTLSIPKQHVTGEAWHSSFRGGSRKLSWCFLSGKSQAAVSMWATQCWWFGQLINKLSMRHHTPPWQRRWSRDRNEQRKPEGVSFSPVVPYFFFTFCSVSMCSHPGLYTDLTAPTLLSCQEEHFTGMCPYTQLPRDDIYDFSMIAFSAITLQPLV